MTDNINGSVAYAWITRFHNQFASTQDYLTNLDRLAGDGDFGGNIASALDRTRRALPASDEATYATVFAAASTGFMATGGTSGPLFGMWFREISKAGDTDAVNVVAIAEGVANGLEVVQKLGGARVGDNTMIDALEPASLALTDAAGRGLSVCDALTAAANAARIGAESTSELVAARGRASYVGELARGVLDPGAVTIALFFEAGANAAGASREWAPVVSAVN
ncbi:dihydroxyacetone kinase subunit DhaL [Microbacterium sp. A196]|uniref:dihydroxyacetone kinase subunit DhaL n=1 Tax=Microbacterium sp. A196 TaxID=3457320 RepID=UPI003FD5C3EB